MTDKTTSRMVLLLIAGIPLTMILAASWLWYFVAKGELDLVATLGTANSGELVQPPRPLQEVELYDGALLAPLGDLEPRWTLLVPWDRAVCDAVCEANLYTTRQIHTAIGKDYKRLQRIFLGTRPLEETALQIPTLTDGSEAPASLEALLSGEHRGLLARRVAADTFADLFAEWSVDDTTWYLVDPAGWIMMSYNGDAHYKDVISDLKFLLKNSSY